MAGQSGHLEHTPVRPRICGVKPPTDLEDIVDPPDSGGAASSREGLSQQAAAGEPSHGQGDEEAYFFEVECTKN